MGTSASTSKQFRESQGRFAPNQAHPPPPHPGGLQRSSESNTFLQGNYAIPLQSSSPIPSPEYSQDFVGSCGVPLPYAQPQTQQPTPRPFFPPQPQQTIHPTQTTTQTSVVKNSSEDVDDGYRWRKYGSKSAKKVNRSYYKCCHPNCSAKKITEISDKNGRQIKSTVYKESHSHDPPSVTHTHVQSDQALRDAASSLSRTEPPSDNNPAPKVILEMSREIDPLEDGFNWRKYGQKVVKGSSHPRSYFKCTYDSCTVKKQVEESEDQYTVTYEGVHYHPLTEGSSTDSPYQVKEVGEKRKRSSQEWEQNKVFNGAPVGGDPTFSFPNEDMVVNFSSQTVEM